MHPYLRQEIARQREEDLRRAARTLALALSLCGSLIRSATWNRGNATSIAPRPAASDPQPRTRASSLA